MSELSTRLRNYIPGENDELVMQRFHEAADEIDSLNAERHAYKTGFDLKSEEAAKLREQLESLQRMTQGNVAASIALQAQLVKLDRALQEIIELDECRWIGAAQKIAKAALTDEQEKS